MRLFDHREKIEIFMNGCVKIGIISEIVGFEWSLCKRQA